MGFPGRSHSKKSAYSAGDPGSIPGSGRYAGEGNGNPLQCSCLENSMDRGAWQAIQSMGLQNMQVKKQQLEPDMKQWTGSKLGKKYIKIVYCNPAYLTTMQSTSCEMLG